MSPRRLLVPAPFLKVGTCKLPCRALARSRPSATGRCTELPRPSPPRALGQAAPRPGQRCVAGHVCMAESPSPEGSRQSAQGRHPIPGAAPAQREPRQGPGPAATPPSLCRGRVCAGPQGKRQREQTRFMCLGRRSYRKLGTSWLGVFVALIIYLPSGPHFISIFSFLTTYSSKKIRHGSYEHNSFHQYFRC